MPKLHVVSGGFPPRRVLPGILLGILWGILREILRGILREILRGISHGDLPGGSPRGVPWGDVLGGSPGGDEIPLPGHRPTAHQQHPTTARDHPTTGLLVKLQDDHPVNTMICTDFHYIPWISIDLDRFGLLVWVEFE